MLNHAFANCTRCLVWLSTIAQKDGSRIWYPTRLPQSRFRESREKAASLKNGYFLSRGEGRAGDGVDGGERPYRRPVSWLAAAGLPTQHTRTRTLAESGAPTGYRGEVKTSRRKGRPETDRIFSRGFEPKSGRFERSFRGRGGRCCLSLSSGHRPRCSVPFESYIGR